MRRFACRILFALAALGLVAAPGRAEVRDVELKAAYIYNFATFTTWPENDTARGAARGPLVVCASPDSALWPSLQALVGQHVNGRAWTVADIAARGVRCDVAVLARSAERPAALAGGVLVVRDGAARAAGQGAAITLVDDDEHIRFDVDTQEAARYGLRFSSRLLRLARNVH